MVIFCVRCMSIPLGATCGSCGRHDLVKHFSIDLYADDSNLETKHRMELYCNSCDTIPSEVLCGSCGTDIAYVNDPINLDPFFVSYREVKELNTFKQSEKDAQDHFWLKACVLYFGTLDIKVEYFPYAKYPELQNQGVDRRITLKDGTCYHIEEKYPETEYATMFVEFYDDHHPDTNGWFNTIDPSFTDYIVYGYKDTKKFYFIPVDNFLQTFKPILKENNSPYKIDDKVRIPGNRTKGWLVPWKDIEDKVQGFRYIQL